MMNNNNAILLLSGGLDSLVSLSLAQKNYNILSALYFDYGQKPAKKELFACKNICNHFNIELKIIKLDWLHDISQNSALCSNSKDNNKSFWIPNRNGIFVNIAAAFAEASNCNYVIIGANKEEAKVFKDNSKNFIDKASEFFTTSTQNNVEVIAPLINLDKKQIIEKALELNTPLELVWSCYTNEKKHCGVCPSCKFLKSALIANNRYDLQKLLF